MHLNQAIEIIADLSGHQPEVHRIERSSGDVQDTCADTAKIREALSFVPRTTLQDGLASEFEWMRESLGRDSALGPIRT